MNAVSKVFEYYTALKSEPEYIVIPGHTVIRLITSQLYYL